MRRRDLLTAGAAAAGLVMTGSPAFLGATPSDPAGSVRSLAADYRAWREAQTQRADYQPEIERAAVATTADRREAAGLSPLELDEDLRWIARFYAARLAAGDAFDHVDAHGRGPGDRIAILHRRHVGTAAENLFKSDIFRHSAQVTAGRFAIDSLMDSPGHRQNILSGAWTHIGIGTAIDGNFMTLVQLFTQRVIFLAEETPLELRAAQPLPPALGRFATGNAELIALVPPGAEPSAANFRPLLNLQRTKGPERTGLHMSRYAVRRSAKGGTVNYSVFPGPQFLVV